MAGYFISSENLENLVKDLLKAYKIFAPFPAAYNKDTFNFSEVKDENLSQIVLGQYRTTDSPKQFIYPLIETVSRYFNDKEYTLNPKPVIVLGVKACDLSAIEVLTGVFLEGDFSDDFYRKRREKSLIISTDCTATTEYCFCTLVGNTPYSEKGFDLNLSPLEDGYAVDVGSKRGDDLIAQNKDYFTALSMVGREKQEKNREQMTAKVKEINAEYVFKASLEEIHKRALDTVVWKEITKKCVECSACNRVCPSCTCFLLLDQNQNQDFERLKAWDNCLQNSYTRVAGGANPRARLSQRLENRYNCKFNYSFERLGRYTCVGCGRCIECCMGRIDMRKAFQAQTKQILLGAKLL